MRTFIDNLRLAFGTFLANPLRTLLTLLGIMIGVTTVILISSVINGLTANVNDLVKSLGTNVYWVFRFQVFGNRRKRAVTDFGENRLAQDLDQRIFRRTHFGDADLVGHGRG